MVGLFDRIRALFGIGVETEDKTEPLVTSQQVEVQVETLPDNSFHYDISLDAPKLRKPIEEATVQAPEVKNEVKVEQIKQEDVQVPEIKQIIEVEQAKQEVEVQVPEIKQNIEVEQIKQEAEVQAPEIKHDSELEQLKHYTELIKQNKLDDNALNEDWE